MGQELITMKKAFVYLRVSGQGQVEGDGFPRQMKACKVYAAKNDIKLVRVFREEGVSGAKDSAARPAFQASALIRIDPVMLHRIDLPMSAEQ
jgi:hypothetical protein